MPLPSALELADAFAAFGERRRDAVTTVRALPDAAQWVVVNPRVRWLPDGHPAVPAKLSEHLDRVRHLSPGGTPSICGRRADGNACVVLGRPDAIPHEVVNVAQGLVSRELRARVFAQTVRQGEELLTAAREAVRGGAPAEDFADLTAIRDRAKALDPAKPDWIARFQDDLRQSCAPALHAFGAARGFAGDQALRSSVYASYLDRGSRLDPNGTVAMALVAYRYETDQGDALLEHLYLTAAGSEPALIPA